MHTQGRRHHKSNTGVSAPIEKGLMSSKNPISSFLPGKRACLGESLAKMELFLFFTSLLQRYDLVQPPGAQLPSTKGNLGTNHSPCAFKVQFKRRV